MPQERLSMRKIRDVLRLSAGGLSKRKIATSLGVSPTAAGDCIRRARQAGLVWPLPEEFDDCALEARLYPPPPKFARDRRPQPDWPAMHRELRRKGVTLQLLWEEHRVAYPEGFGYSRFCELYRAWEGVCRRRVGDGGLRQFEVGDHVVAKRAFSATACFYEPAVNRSYAEMAAHYDTAILPARPKEAAGQGEGFILHPVPLIAR